MLVTIELHRKVEAYFQHNESTFLSDTRQSMIRWIIDKHLREPAFAMLTKIELFLNLS